MYVPITLANLLSPMLIAAVLAWFGAQSTKIIIDLIEGKRLSSDVIYRTGGMPSSHSAFVTAMTMSVLLTEGLSNLFFISLGFSIIVAVDAFGVRNQVGTQAKLINILIKEIKFNLRKHNMKFLGELVGHSGLQVFFGMVTGVISSLIVHFIIF
ncbi:hypothetical protein COV93_04285 [Candidatus Woesearchaeota archaeon CG11_big_fil_rev_8_21_14_0_20_43_8]|nr:MAG: hypothetical protein COV93_04285 [Candidatus Woesearchaeota archaeon CG11_big_fil_rev_8_21_14_0_20_43_8]PIO07008.1 MAG: hypothetical protein COT47_01885 [Candidatus Woesearchaeota archaeon CG08_land_8_20_14_0_20_43_7]